VCAAALLKRALFDDSGSGPRIARWRALPRICIARESCCVVAV